MTERVSPQTDVAMLPGRVAGAIVRPVCPKCAGTSPPRPLPASAYSYLLGLYLGDGCISAHHRGVFRLRIVLDGRYPGIIAECATAMGAVLPNRVGLWRRAGGDCVDVSSYSKHWPCLFPQHGPGRKHLRRILLEPWQQAIVNEHPQSLLRGLIHSDGWRGLNTVNGTGYPRYNFVNKSDDIHQIFCDACDRLGIHWTRPTPKYVSVARAADVARLDEFIGPKR